jgi:hypothetical protein
MLETAPADRRRLRLLGHCRHQRNSAREMPERRARRDPGAARGLAHAHRLRPAFAGQLQRRIDQHAPEIAMMIGLWRWRRTVGERAFRFGGGGHGFPLASPDRECKR